MTLKNWQESGSKKHFVQEKGGGDYLRVLQVSFLVVLNMQWSCDDPIEEEKGSPESSSLHVKHYLILIIVSISLLHYPMMMGSQY